jgi:hypothetical protein
MEKTLPLGIWVLVALYAATGLFGVLVFHDPLPSTERLTDGYGVSYATTISSETAK